MLQGSRCVWLTGEEHPVDCPSCLGCAATGKNPCGYPLPMIRLMLRDRDPEVVGCSATMIGGCPREHGIKKHHAWYINPTRAHARAFGSMFHTAAESLHQPGQEADVELRYHRLLTLQDGREVKVTAQLDALYYVTATRSYQVRIRDYKVVDTLSNSAINRKLKHHSIQFSIQRWILVGLGHEVLSIDLDFIAHKDKRNVNLFPEGDPELPFATLMSLEETEAYLLQRLPPLVDSLEGTLAPPLEAHEEGWRCAYCDVRQECEALYGGPLPALRG